MRSMKSQPGRALVQSRPRLKSLTIPKATLKALATAFAKRSYFFQAGIRGLTLSQGGEPVGALIERSASGPNGIRLLQYDLHTPLGRARLGLDGTLSVISATKTPQALLATVPGLLDSALVPDVDRFGWLKFLY
jgi:hypothetical protein